MATVASSNVPLAPDAAADSPKLVVLVRLGILYATPSNAPPCNPVTWWEKQVQDRRGSILHIIQVSQTRIIVMNLLAYPYYQWLCKLAQEKGQIHNKNSLMKYEGNYKLTGSARLSMDLVKRFTLPSSKMMRICTVAAAAAAAATA